MGISVKCTVQIVWSILVHTSNMAHLLILPPLVTPHLNPNRTTTPDPHTNVHTELKVFSLPYYEENYLIKPQYVL